MISLDGTPYSLDSDAESQICSRVKSIEDRIFLLRRSGALEEKTIRDYYGEKRFQQIAESNAIEGSTLSAGETELAVLKGVTITGHDPAYVRDAISLDKALARIAELAGDREAVTDIKQLHEVHALIMGERPGGGIFRREPVLIRGAQHIPPETWKEIMDQMEQWQLWSAANQSVPGPIRSFVMHAWLTHIHPYIDGNGRTSRAIGNLELIRSGYPPIIIKKVERERYLDCLAESDAGGDIRAFAELVLDRVEGSLIGLEQSAKRKQNLDPVVERMRMRQENELRIWDTSVKLLANILEHTVSVMLDPVGGRCTVRIYEDSLDFQDYIEVCSGRPVPRSWAFTVYVDVPSFQRLEKLAYIGHRSVQMYREMGQAGGPAIYWSTKNPTGFPKWSADGVNSPYAVELTTMAGDGDKWFARLANDEFQSLQTTDLAREIANEVLKQIGVG